MTALRPLTTPPPPEPHHLYVHVPFCRLVCAYCDFVTVAGRAADVPRYVEALLAEMERRPAPGTLETIYFGGGTPSRLPAGQVARLVRAAAERWGSEPVEVSLEANPSRREAPEWNGLRAAGVTRISLGVQSLRDDDLRTLGRGHDAAEAIEAFRSARDAGLDSISLDLMYAIPGQSLAAWEAVLQAAAALRPDHLSLYALSLPLAPDEWAAQPRPGALRWRARMAARQDQDLAAEQYELAEEMLATAGYAHYELSSWARPGHESRHNRAYWERRPYTGVGAGAHSFDGATRWWNARSLDAYLAAVEGGAEATEGRESLSDEAAAFEAVALGLRAVGGLRRSAFVAKFGADVEDRFPAAIEHGTRAGLLEVERDVIQLSRRGRLLANEVLVAFAP